MQETNLVPRRKRKTAIEDGLPKGDERKVNDLSEFERSSLESLLRSRISIAGNRQARMVAGLGPDIAPFEVDDPIEKGKKLDGTRNIRNDPLARLHSHHQIDEAQFYAGRAFQRDWETAERGARAIDFTKEAVDGGRIPEPLSDSQGKARMRLVEIERALGRTMHKVAHAVLVEGMSMEAMALRLFNRHGEMVAKYYGRLFRDALDVLAVEYRLASK